MAGVDSLLRMMASHDADELRLGTDQPPRMLKHGAPVRLSIPSTDDAMLQHLLEGVLLPEHERALIADGKVELSHDGHAVSVKARGDAGAAPAPGTRVPIDVVFRRVTATARPVAAPIAVAASPAAGAPARRAASSHATSPELFERATALRASDIHLCWGEAPVLRIDGKLRTLEDVSVSAAEQLLTEHSSDDAARAELAAGRSVDRALQVDGVGRFRLNLYRTGGKLAAAIRVLPASAPRLADLHFPVALDEVVHAPHGLVIVCGPTGSGKSATLAALAHEALRHRGGVLITLEDPVEYTFSPPAGGLVRQREIGRDVRDFNVGLRDALREDFDILLVGEMRDAESINLALTAAETGHLVLASLHSRSAAGSVERIVDSYAPERQRQIRVQLADALRAVIAQRLLPRARGAGRIPAVEILRGNHSVASLIRDGKTAQIATTLQSSRKEGMLPMERCLAELVRSSQITRDVAVAAANDVDALNSYLTT